MENDSWFVKDHYCTDEIVCPYCKHEFSDSDEVFDCNYNDFIHGLECDGCGKDFDVSRTVTVTYSSHIPKEEKDA